MRGSWAFVLAVLMAGCAASSPAVDEAPATPVIQTETVAWDVDDFVARSGGCVSPPGFCFGGHIDAWPTFNVDANQRIEGFAFTLESTDGQPSPDPVNIEVWCIEDEEPCGANATVEARSALPASVQASGLQWPWGASLGIRFYRDEDLVKYGELSETIHVHGDLVVALDPSLPAPVFHEVRTEFVFDTVTGVCLMEVEDGCHSGPWRTLDLPAARGRIVRVVANATWDAASPASSSMRFSVTCYNTGADCTDERFEANGPNPLAMDTGNFSGLHFPDGVQLEMHVEETGVEPYPSFTPLTRQAFHLEGTIVSLVEVVDE